MDNLQEKGSDGGDTGETGTGHLGGRASVWGDGLLSSRLASGTTGGGGRGDGGTASGASGDLGINLERMLMGL